MYAQASARPLAVLEYGIDAYATEYPELSRPLTPRGHVDAAAQARWLLPLVEDLERHAITCTEGCADPQVTSGGTVMAWVDEYWKGRVIDSLQADNRTAAMAALCPDNDAHAHSPCGYPSSAQPDGYVNEEWFGLFEVPRVCLARKGVLMDQMLPRAAWQRLKLLWTRGGCIRFVAAARGVDGSPYGAAETNQGMLPGCGVRIANLRAALLDSELSDAWDGLDCTLQAAIHSAEPTACPPVPEHMDSAECGGEASCDGSDNCTRALHACAHLAALAMPMQYNATSPQRNERCSCDAAIQVEAAMARAVPTPPDDDCQPVPAPSGLSFLATLLIFSGGVALTRLYSGLAWRHRLLSRWRALLSRWCGPTPALHIRGSNQAHAKAASEIRAKGGERMRAALLSRRHRTEPSLGAADWRVRVFADGPEQGHLVRSSLAIADSVSAQPELIAWLRGRLAPIARHLANMFGFQCTVLGNANASPASVSSPATPATPSKDLGLSPAGAGAGARAASGIMSSLDAQLEHVCCLLASEMDRAACSTPLAGTEGAEARVQALETRLAQACVLLHDRTLACYIRWLKHVDLPSHAAPIPDAQPSRSSMLPTVGSLTFGDHSDSSVHWLTDDAARDEEAFSACCHRLLLYYLLWGEAANLRHAPECLCFLYYCASHALLQPEGGGGGGGSSPPLARAAPVVQNQPNQRGAPARTLAAGGASTGDKRWSGSVRGSMVVDRMPLNEGDFLRRIVTPVCPVPSRVAQHERTSDA